MSNFSNRSVLLIGNFLSGKVGNYCVCEDLVGRLESDGIRVLTASDRMARIPRLFDIVSTVWTKRREYAMANVDVYSGLGFGLAEAACLTLRAAGKPFALTLRGGNLPKYAAKWPRRVHRLLRSATVVTTPSRYLLESMNEYRGDIQLLPNPLQLDRYTYRWRAQPSPKLVWIRSFHRTYNPTLAAEVVAEAAQEYPDVELTMVGPDKGDGSLQATKQAAAELGVSGRIHFTGGVPKQEIPRYLDRGDIFINTTNVDNTPVSVLEAMACGLCVVSTNVGGMPDLVDDGVNALLVPPNDKTAMTDAIRRVLQQEGLAQSLSHQAHCYVQQFDWVEILPRWNTLIEEVSAT
jgi:glycosyltransferase involved in cell wall biosynthesis